MKRKMLSSNWVSCLQNTEVTKAPRVPIVACRSLRLIWVAEWTRPPIMETGKGPVAAHGILADTATNTIGNTKNQKNQDIEILTMTTMMLSSLVMIQTRITEAEILRQE